MASDIFVSYAREDEARIAPLARALAAAGKSVFWDRHIPAGKTWRSWIGKALEETRCVVVAWTRSSVESEWVTAEAEEARRRGVLVPILLDRVDPPFGFRHIQAADLSACELRAGDAAFDHFMRDLEVVLGARGTTPGAPATSVDPVATPSPPAAATPSLSPDRPASELPPASRGAAPREESRSTGERRPPQWTVQSVVLVSIGVALVIGIAFWWNRNSPAVRRSGDSGLPSTSANVRTIAEIHAQRVALIGKPVAVRGKVERVRMETTGRNWIYLRDVSGSTGAREELVAVITADRASYGEVVVATGTVRAGDGHAVILDDAKLSK